MNMENGMVGKVVLKTGLHHFDVGLFIDDMIQPKGLSIANFVKLQVRAIAMKHR